MNGLPVAAEGQSLGRTAQQTKASKRSYRVLLAVWLGLIACGVLAAVLYTNYLKRQITVDISKQTGAQLAEVRADYERQLTALKDSVAGDMAGMQAKVESLNELLAFTKDSASDKTDNSNQLYTQLTEVKNKLDELQKNLDVLK